MNDEHGSLNCPSCGWNTMLFVGELDLDDELACKLCGTSTRVKDLRTSTGEALAGKENPAADRPWEVSTNTGYRRAAIVHTPPLAAV